MYSTYSIWITFVRNLVLQPRHQGMRYSLILLSSATRHTFATERQTVSSSGPFLKKLLLFLFLAGTDPIIFYVLMVSEKYCQHTTVKDRSEEEEKKFLKTLNKFKQIFNVSKMRNTVIFKSFLSISFSQQQYRYHKTLNSK